MLSYQLFIENLRIRDHFNKGRIPFINDVPLLDRMILKYQDLPLYFIYKVHDKNQIIEKIAHRTTLINTSEFNTLLEQTINEIFPKRLSELKINGKYELYLPENKISIIIRYNEKLLYDWNPKILEIVTVMMDSSVNDCQGTLIINDENFLN